MTARTTTALGLVVVLLAAPACDSSTGPALPSADASWRITYLAEAPTVPSTTTEVVEVQRPYRARTTILEADGEALVSGTIWTEQGLYLMDAAGLITQVQVTAPGRPGPDVRLDVSLPDAVAAGVVQASEPSQVAGLACVEYATRGPLDANLPEAPTADERTVSCVDAQGRVLRDEWELDGTVIRRRTATRVESGADLGDEELFAGHEVAPVPDALVLSDVRAVEGPLDEAQLAVAFPDTLDGLALDALVEIRDLPLPSGSAQSTQLTWQATYVDATRLVILRQSRTLSGPVPVLPDAEPFALPPLERAVLERSFDGLTVTGELDGLRVEVRGPIDRAAMASLGLVRP